MANEDSVVASQRAAVTKENLSGHKATHTKANSYWLKDIKGIPVSRVCSACVHLVKQAYKPEIFGEGRLRYEDVVDDRIEPED